MDEYTAEVEADLQRYYRIDLGDLFRGRLSLRRLGVLVAALPPESATMSALAPLVADVEPDPDRVPRQWSTDQHLLANVADGIGALTHLYLSAHSDSAPAKWVPMDRPGVTRTPAVLRPDPAQVERLRARNRGGMPDGD